MADVEAAHSRWILRLNRSEDNPRYQDAWAWEQCGGCIHWLPLAGTLGTDWGVCSSQRSPFDREAMFEHDGCDFFEEDPHGWRTPERTD